MAKSALGKAFYLLLLTSVIQGFQDVEVFHYKKMEAVAGQDVVLPCTINGRSDLKLVSIEWSKNINENTKLAVYSRKYCVNLFRPNISMQIENKTLGSNLHLPGVSKWDSGVYICDIVTFPLGTTRRETQLEIKDVLSICDANITLEVRAGENVTIRCTPLPNVQYRWTKNKKLLSENASLELSWVTDTHGGAYTLTVNTGNKSLRKTFTISVLTTTTSLHTVVARSTREMTTQSTQQKVHPEVTSSTFPENSSTLGSITENSDKPGATPTLITGNTPDIEDAYGALTNLLLRSIIVAVLILIVVAAFLYTKQRMKQREKLVRKNTSNYLMASNQNNHRRVRFNHCSSDVAGESSSDV